MKYDEKVNKVIEKLSTIEANIRTEINQFEGECQIIQTKQSSDFNKINQTLRSIEDS